MNAGKHQAIALRIQPPARPVKHAPAKTTETAAPAAEPASVAAPTKERLFAHPDRPAARAAGGAVQLADPIVDELTQAAPLGFKPRDFTQKPLKKGARVIGGTILGHLGKRTKTEAPHLTFEIRPAGAGAPRIDPKPILDGWKLLESTAIYRVKGKNPFFGEDAENPSVGQLLLLSKEQLIQRVLHDSRIQIYGCGIADVRSGQIDRRVLATMLYLAANGLKPTITALKCGHSYLTTSGNVSEHTSGDAVDIAAINGTPILDHQGKGSITDTTIQRLLALQGAMKPHQIISLMTPEDFGGADNILSLPDHDNHIHVGFHPMYNSSDGQGALKAGQWIKLIDRLNNIDNPTVPVKPSKDAIPVKPGDHAGD